jgi:hypothetical protein
MIDIELMIHVALKRPSKICVIYKHSLCLTALQSTLRIVQTSVWRSLRDVSLELSKSCCQVYVCCQSFDFCYTFQEK